MLSWGCTSDDFTITSIFIQFNGEGESCQISYVFNWVFTLTNKGGIPDQAIYS